MFNIKDYWENRYIGAENKKGYGSGYGSEKEELSFKVNVINKFIIENNIKSICDYGCGSGNFLIQLPKNYESYIAYDISNNSIQLCRERVLNQENIIFTNSIEDCDESADLGLSIDVIFHQVDYDDLIKYMSNLFRHKYVIIYTTDYEENNNQKCYYIYRRSFSKIINELYPHYKLFDRLECKVNNDKKEFLFYQRS